MRRAQFDILEFCHNPDYKELAWPDDYWPGRDEEPGADQWNSAIGQFKRDLEELRRLCADETIDLRDEISHGKGQTYLREILLVVDHNAYHLGQFMTVRRLLGI
jgi:hypothetical protein